MSNFNRALALVLAHEGGYANHPQDPGGSTMRGVTQRTYDSYRARMKQPRRDVRQVTDAEIAAIYRGQYWNAVKADDLPAGVAYAVFDAAVNSGPGRAVRWLQEIVGAKSDGIVGNETLSKVRARDPLDLISAYCDHRLAFMRRLAHWPTFGKGWSRRVAEVRAKAKEFAAGVDPIPPQREAPGRADGPESATATLKDAMQDKGAIGALTGLLGSAGALASGSGPVQYAIAALLVLGAVAGVWWLVRRRP